MNRIFLKVLAAGCFRGLCAAHRQVAAELPQFDAASVKTTNLRPTFPMRGNQPDASQPSHHFDPGHVDYHIVGIGGLVFDAWPLADYQIVWPAGVPDGRFDVSATMPPNTTRAQFQLMLRRLLAERFKLATHTETRNTKVYALRISPRGLKIQKTENPPRIEEGRVVFGGRNLQPGSTNPSGFSAARCCANHPWRFIRVYGYLIAYAPDEKPLWVVAVFHGHRSPRVMAAILRGREEKPGNLT